MSAIHYTQSAPKARPSHVPKAPIHGWRLARPPRTLARRLGRFATGRTYVGQHVPTAALTSSRIGAVSASACVVLFRNICSSRPSNNLHNYSSLPFGNASPVAWPRSRSAAIATTLTRAPSALFELVTSLAASPYRDLYVVSGAAIGAAVWVKLFDLLAANGTLEQKLSRKLVHASTGPIFVLTWILFSAAPAARYLAALVPMLNFARLVAVGSGLLKDPGLVNSVSRSGDRGELLKGPLFYVMTLVAATVLCWRDNPAGLIAVAMMCGGDGLADIVGRRWGNTAKLPYNTSKSWAGSAAMLVGGYAMSYGLISLFCELGFFACYPPSVMLSCLGTIALAATVVESLPINQYVDDNLSVPVVAAGLSMVLMPQAVQAMSSTMAAVAASPVTGLAVIMADAATAPSMGPFLL